MSRRVALPLLLLAALLAGCSSTTWSNGQVVRFGVRADEVSDLESRTIDHAIAGDVVRIRNLAGTVSLEQADVNAVQVEATVYARGRGEEHTRMLLDGLEWIETVDREDRPVWTLNWPIDSHRQFHYSTAGPGFEMTTTRTLGRRVTVTTRKTEATPTLFADLRVVCPPGTILDMHNLAGPIEADLLAGTFDLRTSAGAIDIGSFDGELEADTGSGDITVGTLAGWAHLDTGSGDIIVNGLEADASLDTGSGDIVIHAADTQRVRADTGSGRILLEGGRAGRIDADTGSGNIDIEGVAFHDLRADTGSGDITIRSPLTETGRIDADTGSGNVNIVAGHDASFDLRSSIGSGRLRVGYEDARLRHDGRYVTGAVRGDGQMSIRADTGSGDCDIRPEA